MIALKPLYYKDYRYFPTPLYRGLFAFRNFLKQLRNLIRLNSKIIIFLSKNRYLTKITN
jgi:hypothetical protein